ncbi:MAG: 8-oxoguanine deaminase, partial [Caldilineaceae bacterium]|nr:8-oxoguanine deaminase [Caldilineaceae bacterium]
MTNILLTNADLLLTMDSARRELVHGALLIEENVITWVGTPETMPPLDDDTTRYDMRGKLVMPGMVNTHHH